MQPSLDRPVKSRDEERPIYNRCIDVLLVCTANQCRSPMAEVLLRNLIATHGVRARVASAGLYPSGSPATPDAVQVMADRGLDLRRHQSRQIDHDILGHADLVVTMTREHVREVAVGDVAFLDKTFTLKELVMLGDLVGPRRPGEPYKGWLARLAASRRREALLGVGHDDAYDVADPIGGTRAQYRATAKELEELLTRMLELVWNVPKDGEARGRSA
jgi:protein-tyrosine phosphatase